MNIFFLELAVATIPLILLVTSVTNSSSLWRTRHPSPDTAGVRPCASWPKAQMLR